MEQNNCTVVMLMTVKIHLLCTDVAIRRKNLESDLPNLEALMETGNRTQTTDGARICKMVGRCLPKLT